MTIYNTEEQKIEVLGVNFLTSAAVMIKLDDKEHKIVVSVDIINREVFVRPDFNLDINLLKLSEMVFEYLDKVNTLPENFFEASEDIYSQAANAKQEHDLVKEGMSDV